MLLFASKNPQLARSITNFAFAVFLMAMTAVPMAPYCSLTTSDFPLYYLEAVRFVAGKGPDVYALQLQLGKLGSGLNEPPFLLPLVAPLGALPYPLAKLFFDGFMISLVAASAVILSRLAHLSNRKTLLLLGLIAASGPVFEIIKVSKPSPLLFFGLTMSLSCLQKAEDLKAGAWATLCLLKPQEALPFFAFALGCGRWRFILGTAITVLALSALTFPLFGVHGYANYLERISYINAHTEFAGTDEMPVLAAQFLRLDLLKPALATRLANAIYLLGLIGVVVFGRTQRRSANWWLTGAVVAFLSMACIFPYMFSYDLVILFPGICLLVQKLVQQRRKLLLACVSVSIAVYLVPLYVFVHYYPYSRLDPHFCALVVLMVVSIVMATQFRDGLNDTGKDQNSP